MRCSNGKSDSVRMKFTFWFKCLANEKDLSRMRPVPFWSLVSSLFLSVPLLLALTCSSFSFFFLIFFSTSRVDFLLYVCFFFFEHNSFPLFIRTQPFRSNSTTRGNIFFFLQNTILSYHLYQTESFSFENNTWKFLFD